MHRLCVDAMSGRILAQAEYSGGGQTVRPSRASVRRLLPLPEPPTPQPPRNVRNRDFITRPRAATNENEWNCYCPQYSEAFQEFYDKLYDDVTSSQAPDVAAGGSRAERRGNFYPAQVVFLNPIIFRCRVPKTEYYQPFVVASPARRVPVKPPPGVSYGECHVWRGGRQIFFYPPYGPGQKYMLLKPLWMVKSLHQDVEKRCSLTGEKVDNIPPNEDPVPGPPSPEEMVRFRTTQLRPRHRDYSDVELPPPGEELLPYAYRKASAGQTMSRSQELQQGRFRVHEGFGGSPVASRDRLHQSYQRYQAQNDPDPNPIAVPQTSTFAKRPYHGPLKNSNAEFATGRELLGQPGQEQPNEGIDRDGKPGEWYLAFVPAHHWQSLPFTDEHGHYRMADQHERLRGMTIRLFAPKKAPGDVYGPLTFQVPQKTEVLQIPNSDPPRYVTTKVPGVWCRFWPEPKMDERVPRLFWGFATLPYASRVEVVSVERPWTVHLPTPSLGPLPIESPPAHQPSMEGVRRCPSYLTGVVAEDDDGNLGKMFEVRFLPYMIRWQKKELNGVLYPNQFIAVNLPSRRIFIPNDKLTQSIEVQPPIIKCTLRGKFEKPYRPPTGDLEDTDIDMGDEYEYTFGPNDNGTEMVLKRTRNQDKNIQGFTDWDYFYERQFNEGIPETIEGDLFVHYRVIFPAYDMLIDENFGNGKFPKQVVTILPPAQIITVNNEHNSNSDIQPNDVTIPVLKPTLDELVDVSVTPDMFRFIPPQINVGTPQGFPEEAHEWMSRNAPAEDRLQRLSSAHVQEDSPSTAVGRFH